MQMTQPYGFVLHQTEDDSKQQYPLVYLDHQFIMDKMNTIFHRLIGVGDSSLTTANPTRDADGNYTVLQLLHITQPAFSKLVRFLRVGWMPETHFDPVMEVAIILGGFPSVDTFIRNYYQQITQTISQDKSLPQRPEEDTENQYQWIPLALHRIFSSDLNSEYGYLANGWSCTGHIYLYQDDDKKSSYTYFRKPLASQGDVSQVQEQG